MIGNRHPNNWQVPPIMLLRAGAAQRGRPPNNRSQLRLPASWVVFAAASRSATNWAAWVVIPDST
jgi:hypothetical protein